MYLISSLILGSLLILLEILCLSGIEFEPQSYSMALTFMLLLNPSLNWFVVMAAG